MSVILAATTFPLQRRERRMSARRPTIYSDPRTTTSRKIDLTIDLLGIAVDRRPIDLASGEHWHPEFVAVNPNGKVPVLVEGEFVLWESNAIQQYLASKVPDSTLWPCDPRARADIARWQFWEASAWSVAVHILMQERLIKQITHAGEADPAKVEQGLREFRHCANILETHLADREWLVGEEPTLADIAIVSQLMYASRIGLPLVEYPNLSRWHARVDALSSAAQE